MPGIFFKVKPTKLQAFIQFINWGIQIAMECEPRTLRLNLVQAPDEKNAWFVYEAYGDKKAFEENQANEPYQRWISKNKPDMVSDFQTLLKPDALLASAS